MTDPSPPTAATPADAPSPGGAALRNVVRIAGLAAAALAVAFLVRTLVEEWPEVQDAVGNANPALVLAATVAAALGMMGLGVLWWEVLHGFHGRERLRDVMAWYFAGELGKYLPGGIWPVVGRGELATRNGVPRPVAYGTTAMSLGIMCVGATALAAVLLPWSFGSGELRPEHLVLLVLPIGLVVIHPAVMGRAFALIDQMSKGRVVLEALPWGRMVQLVATAVPTWICVGLTSVLLGEAFGYDLSPPRVIFAATLAWVAGFLAVPVPAGAGIREVVFVALCGLDQGPAVLVATAARLLFIVVDAVGGLAGLAHLRRVGGETGPDR